MKKKSKQQIRDSLTLAKFEHELNRTFLVTNLSLLATYTIGLAVILLSFLNLLGDDLFIKVLIATAFVTALLVLGRKTSREINRLMKELIRGEKKIRELFKQLE